jgi:hypothetical protein
MTVQLDLKSLRADGARVECTFVTGEGRLVRGEIEKSFFEEFATVPAQTLTPVKQQRIVADNAAYLAEQAERQLRLGHRTVTIV